jgi:hypothetical protein
MDNQEKLLKAIRQNLEKSASLIDEIAAVLNISYDASHRRVSQKSKFSIEEAIILCRHYSLSMDVLFADGSKVIVEKTSEIRNMEDMEAYFRHSADNLSSFLNVPDAKMYYSAKDIPLFYTIGGTLLSKFKLYVWLNLLSGTQNQGTFENFTIGHSLLEHSQKLRAVYENVEVNEVWNDTTINSSLQQIYYFFQSGLLSLANAMHLCTDLKAILQTAEDRCCKEGSRFNLYYNELLILNNNVLLSSPQQQSLFVPYTMLGYFITSDAATCGNALDFLSTRPRTPNRLTKAARATASCFSIKPSRRSIFISNGWKMW